MAPFSQDYFNLVKNLKTLKDMYSTKDWNVTDHTTRNSTKNYEMVKEWGNRNYREQRKNVVLERPRDLTQSECN